MNLFESAIDDIATVIERKYRAGAPFIATYYGRPAMRVSNIRPFNYENGGRFRNALPKLAGSFAVRSLYVDSYPNQAQYPGVILEATPESLYGVRASVALMNYLSVATLGPNVFSFSAKDEQY